MKAQIPRQNYADRLRHPDLSVARLRDGDETAAVGIRASRMGIASGNVAPSQANVAPGGAPNGNENVIGPAVTP